MTRRAVTLVEMMVTTGIFVLIITIATSLLIRTVQSYQNGESPARLREQARIILYRLAYSIRNAESIVEPTYLELMEEDHSYIVMHVFGPEGTRTVGYRRTPEDCIEEIVYSNDYGSGEPNTGNAIATRVVCRRVNQFTVGIEEPTNPSLFTIKMEVQVSKSPLNLQTRINVRNPQ